MTTAPPTANNGNDNSKNSDQNSKKQNRKKARKQNTKKGSNRLFKGAATDGPMKGIVIATDRPTPMSGLIDKFMKGLQAYANQHDMPHVADCIKNMEDLTIDDFQPESIDFSDCVSKVEVLKLDSNGNKIVDVQGKPVSEWIEIVTDSATHRGKEEQRKWNSKAKQEEYRKFESDKKICLSTAELQWCTGTIDTMETMPEYTTIKKNRDLIESLKLLQSICFANKDGGNTFRPYKNIKIRERHLSHKMNDRTACTYKEDVKTNFESSLAIAGHFPFGTCSLELILGKENKTWKHYLRMSEKDQVRLEKEANELDKSMMFILGCKNNGMRNDLKCMSLYGTKKYPRTVESACNVYHNQYKKKTRKQKGNEDDQEDNNEDDENKELISTHLADEQEEDKELISIHLTDEQKDDNVENNTNDGDDEKSKTGFVGIHVVKNAADVLAVEDFCEPGEDDGESLVDKEDVMCCHLTPYSYCDSDDEDFPISHDIHNNPTVERTDVEFIVETVDDEFTPKFVYEDAEELFPNATAGAEPTAAHDQEPVIQQRDNETNSTSEELGDAKSMIDDDMPHNLDDDTPDGSYPDFWDNDTPHDLDNDAPHESCPDFWQGEE